MLLMLLTISCVNPFAPGVVDGLENSGGILTHQKSPEDALINLKYAYTFQDSLVYSELLDTTYVFRTWDYETSPPTPVEWNRDVELRITGKMFRYFTSIDLVWNKTTYSDSFMIDLKLRSTIQKSFTLTFNGGIQIPVLTGEVRFIFEKKNDEKWCIISWEDLKI